MKGIRVMDEDGYPTEQELDKITEWPLSEEADFQSLVNYIKDLWRYPDYIFEIENAKISFIDSLHKTETKIELTDKENKYIAISTGGWSGNEQIISALRKNRVFWSICWVSSRRGGHYLFQVIYI